VPTSPLTTTLCLPPWTHTERVAVTTSHAVIRVISLQDDATATLGADAIPVVSHLRRVSH
jgi:hypothetical protein